MKLPAKNRVGLRYGRLVVIAFHSRVPGSVKWICRCDCGKETVVYGCNLTSSHTTSCGCRALEVSTERFYKHGLSGTRQHKVWSMMLERCENQNNQDYKDYGGRGIKVCPAWHSFETWWMDMKDGYSDNLTIDRIDTNGNYEPGNCRWATVKEQANNRRHNHRVTHNGKTQTLAEWAADAGIQQRTLSKRLHCGWTTKDALTIQPWTVRKYGKQAELFQ